MIDKASREKEFDVDPWTGISRRTEYDRARAERGGRTSAEPEAAVVQVALCTEQLLGWQVEVHVAALFLRVLP